jgi:hypothetical protein
LASRPPRCARFRASDGTRLVGAAKRALHRTDERDDAIQSASNEGALFVGGKLSTQIDGSPALSAPHEFAATPQSQRLGRRGEP